MTLPLIICRTLYPFNISLSPNSILTYEKKQIYFEGRKLMQFLAVKRNQKITK